MKWISLLFTMLFASMTLVQYNDPDPLSWMVIYGTMTFLTGWHFFRSPSRLTIVLFSITGIAALGWCGYLFSAFQDFLLNQPLSRLYEDVKMTEPGVESAREFIGLTFVLVSSFTELLHARLAGNGTTERQQ